MAHPIRMLCLALLCAPAVLCRAAAAPEPEVAVVAIEAGRGAAAQATVRVHALPAQVWRLLTSCRAALRIVPGLLSCEVQGAAADGSWQEIRQVVSWSWYLPKVSYVVKATYREPERIDFREMAGDLAVLRGSWVLRRDGDTTVAHYAFEVVPRSWVPGWIVRRELRRDLPRMLRALRAHAEQRAPAAPAKTADDG